MDGSTVQKVLRFAGAHLRRPHDLRRYLANLRRPPLDSGLPWFTFGAIDVLARWIKAHHRVLECGCGADTQ